MGTDADQWRPIGDLAWSRRIANGVWIGVPLLGFGYVSYQLGSLLGEILDLATLGIVGLSLVFFVGPAALGAWAWILLNPVPFANFEDGRIRIRGRAVRFEDIDVARLLQLGGRVNGVRHPDKTVLGIRIGRRRGPQVSIVLGRNDSSSMNREYRERLAEVIRRSGIRYPESSYDPTGTFAQYNFPEHFDKEGALVFVMGSTADAASVGNSQD